MVKHTNGANILKYRDTLPEKNQSTNLFLVYIVSSCPEFSKIYLLSRPSEPRMKRLYFRY